MSIAEKLTQIAENEQKVYEAGKKAEYDAFWDTYQANGSRTQYDTAFGGEGWTNETFKPKYDIKPTRATYMFRVAKIAGDLVEICESLGISLDFSECVHMQELFSNAPNITRVGVIDIRKATNVSNMFAWSNAKTIDKIIVTETTPMNYFPGAMPELENITIEGTIGQNNFNVQYSTKLTHDSLMSIINALQDKSTDTSGTVWTVTLGPTNIAKLTAEEQQIAHKKGWLLG